MSQILSALPPTEKTTHEYPSDQEIAARAFDIWMSEGCSHACIDYWCRAEENLLLETYPRPISTGRLAFSAARIENTRDRLSTFIASDIQ